MKPSLDVNSIQEFCIQHVEKFVFGGVILLLLLFAVQAVGSLQGVGPDFSPEDLKGLADSARQHWSETDPDDYLDTKGIKVHPYWEEAHGILKPVPIDQVKLEVPWNAPLRPPLRKREQPALMAIEDLRASAGNGAVPATGNMGAGMALEQDAGPMMVQGRKAIGRRWVVVTGIIDIQAQIAAYKQQFEDAVVRNWQRDVPIYLGYRIERAEVTGDEDEEQLESLWKSINVLDAFKAAGYRSPGRPLVDRRFFPQQNQESVYPMVFPLPPLMRRELGPEVAHYPEIPLLVDMPESELGRYGRQLVGEREPGEEGEAAGAPGTEKTESVDPFDRGMRPGRQTGAGGMPGDMSEGPGMPGMPRGMPGMPGMPGGGYPGMEESMTYDDGMSGPTGYGGPGTRGTKPVEHQLFRFFDFEVTPGKRYRYRVKPVLKNPNYGLPEQYVISEKLTEKRYIEPDEWSEPSELVTVPYDSRLVAGPAKAPPTIFHEPSSEVVLVTLRMEDGLEASMEETVRRGHLANFESEIEEDKRAGPMGAMGGMEEMMGMPPEMGGPEPSGRRRNDDDEEKEIIEHDSNMLVLDINGGERLHRSDRTLTEPGYLLLMGPDGSLIVRNELDDQEDYLAYHVEEKPREKREEPGMEGMMPGMEEGMMEDMYGLGGEESSGGRRRGRRSRR